MLCSVLHGRIKGTDVQNIPIFHIALLPVQYVMGARTGPAVAGPMFTPSLHHGDVLLAFTNNYSSCWSFVELDSAADRTVKTHISLD